MYWKRYVLGNIAVTGFSGLGGRLDHSIPACKDQSTAAQRAETTVAECSLTSCVCVRFLIGSHTKPGQRHSQHTPTSLGHGCMRD